MLDQANELDTVLDTVDACMLTSEISETATSAWHWILMYVLIAIAV